MASSNAGSQTGAWVFGVEGTGSWTNIDGEGPNVDDPKIRINSKIESLFTVTGRIGYAADRALFYVKGGGAVAHEKHWWSGTFVTDAPSENRWGWLVGGGTEYAFAPSWSAKIEYNFIGFGSESVTHTEIANPSDVFDTKIKQHLHVVKFGLNYRFGGAVATRY